MGNRPSGQFFLSENTPGRAVRYLPAPPQTRTSGVTASGSSVISFAKIEQTI